MWKATLVVSKIVFGCVLHQLIGTEEFHFLISSSPITSQQPKYAAEGMGRKHVTWYDPYGREVNNIKSSYPFD